MSAPYDASGKLMSLKGRDFPIGEVAARFWPNVAKGTSDACWDWKGCRFRDGYGRFSFGDKRHLAHRVAYALEHGATPGGLGVLHRCDNRACCNPAHLFAGTHADNMRDMATKGRGRSGARGRGPLKLDAAQAAEIRALAKTGVPQRVIADRYGIHQVTVSEIHLGKIWKAANAAV